MAESEPITVTITFTTERDAEQFCNYYAYMPALKDARESIRAELARRRKVKREAKKAGLMVTRQGDSYMLKRDWK